MQIHVFRMLPAMLALVSFSSAQITTRLTGPIPLDGSRGAGIAKFKLPGVTVNKSLTVNKGTGAVTQKCTFKNSSAQNVDFLFCDMVSLNSSFTNSCGPSGTDPCESTNTCNLTVLSGVWQCVKGGGKKNITPPSYHFGCTEVHLAPGASLTTPPKTATNPRFVGRVASDFQVSYGDIFNLSGKTFNAASCASLGCFGADADTNYETPPADPNFGNLSGFWILQKIPITDPYNVWQELNGLRHRAEYAPLSAGLSLPSEFPVQLPDLPRSSSEVQPPLSYTQDLNLWDILTMSAPPDQSTNVVLVPYLRGSAVDFGLTIETDPRELQIQGGSMGIGTLTIRRPEQIPEGARAELSIQFVDPQRPEDGALWEQVANLVQDSDPPIIDSHQLSFQGDFLSVSLIATDRTTSPIAANFWYSADDGVSWTAVPLDSSADILELPSVNRFTTTIQMPATVRQIQYFYNVQDCVQNNAWFGIGFLTLR